MTAAISNLHDWVTYKDAREVLTGQTVAVEANPDYRSSRAALVAALLAATTWQLFSNGALSVALPRHT